MNKPVNTTKTTAWNGALIADQMTKLRKDIEYTRTSINSRRADYSNEGFSKLKNERYAPLQERLAELTNVSAEWSAAARNHANQIKASLFPTAKPGTAEALQAELTASRILGRGTLDETTTRELFKMEPSPTRTLLIEEAQARGAISPDLVDGYTLESSEEYHDAVRQADSVKGVQQGLNAKARALDEMFAGTDNPGTQVWHDLDMSTVKDADVAFDVETPTTYWDMPTSQFGIRD